MLCACGIFCLSWHGHSVQGILREDEASPVSSILGWWVARYVCVEYKESWS
jgi:hypothetical protein